VTPRDLQNDAVSGSRVAGNVNGRTSPFNGQAELFEIPVQIGRDRGLGSFQPRLQGRKIDLVRGVIARRPPALLECSQVVSQSRVFERTVKAHVEPVGIVNRV
jgi:hypothetical protein